jgi:hypothetical protein
LKEGRKEVKIVKEESKETRKDGMKGSHQYRGVKIGRA